MTTAERLEVDIHTPEPAWREALPDAEAVCRRAAAAAFAAAGARFGAAEASLVLAGDEQVRTLNRDYCGADRPTNVLSFAAMEGPGPAPDGGGRGPAVLGDVVLAYETIAAEAAAAGRALTDHLSHLVVHGMLHLLGYDHHTDAEADAMERLEVRVLADLGLPNPYARPVDD